MALLVVVLNQISIWHPAPLIACAAAGALLLVLFVRHERAIASPLVDLGLFDEAAFSSGALAAMLSYALLYGMFFVISFALIRGYHNTAQLAGFKLAIIPVALGLVAPFSGALGERLGLRFLPIASMAICISALATLAVLASEARVGLDIGLTLLALFGAGLGLFIAPNNNAAMLAAPKALSGAAGAMLNLMRVLGTCLGVAGAASVLSWRIEALTGSHDSAQILFEGHPQLGAVESCFMMLAAFATIAGVLSLIRGKP